MRRRRFAIEPEQTASPSCATAGTTCTTRRPSPPGVPRTGLSTRPRSPTAARSTSASTPTRPTWTSRLRCSRSSPSRTWSRPVMTPEGRDMAAMVERLYIAWKDRIGIELMSHKACVTKGLYGRTAASVTWDERRGLPHRRDRRPAPEPVSGLEVHRLQASEWALYVCADHPGRGARGLGSPLRHRHRSEGKPYPYIVHPTYFGLYDSPLGGPSPLHRPSRRGLRLLVSASPARTPGSRLASPSSSRRGTPSSSATRWSRTSATPSTGAAAVRPAVQHLHARAARGALLPARHRAAPPREGRADVRERPDDPPCRGWADLAADRVPRHPLLSRRAWNHSPTRSSRPVRATGSKPSSRGCPSSRSSSSSHASTAS